MKKVATLVAEGKNVILGLMFQNLGEDEIVRQAAMNVEESVLLCDHTTTLGLLNIWLSAVHNLSKPILPAHASREDGVVANAAFFAKKFRHVDDMLDFFLRKCEKREWELKQCLQRLLEELLSMLAVLNEEDPAFIPTWNKLRVMSRKNGLDMEKALKNEFSGHDITDRKALYLIRTFDKEDCTGELGMIKFLFKTFFRLDPRSLIEFAEVIVPLLRCRLIMRPLVLESLWDLAKASADLAILKPELCALDAAQPWTVELECPSRTIVDLKIRFIGHELGERPTEKEGKKFVADRAREVSDVIRHWRKETGAQQKVHALISADCTHLANPSRDDWF